MIEALLGELAVAGGTEVVTAAGEHLAEKIKTSKDIKKLFRRRGKMVIILVRQFEKLLRNMLMIVWLQNIGLHFLMKEVCLLRQKAELKRL